MVNLLLNLLYIYLVGIVVVGLPLYLKALKLEGPRAGDLDIHPVVMFLGLTILWPVWSVLFTVWFFEAYQVEGLFMEYNRVWYLIPKFHKHKWEDEVRVRTFHILCLKFTFEYKLRVWKQ